MNLILSLGKLPEVAYPSISSTNTLPIETETEAFAEADAFIKLAYMPDNDPIATAEADAEPVILFNNTFGSTDEALELPLAEPSIAEADTFDIVPIAAEEAIAVPSTVETDKAFKEPVALPELEVELLPLISPPDVNLIPVKSTSTRPPLVNLNFIS
ncbi:MAG: hypothetical protein GY829_07345 [Gammaproteobacteria bacterium]|nr:hypothetical protein [Gammaproteobacteria bacterium]